MKIDKKMSILRILQEFPDSQKIFNQFKMSCAGCMGASAESLERGAGMHGVDPDRITEELNNFVASET